MNPLRTLNTYLFALILIKRARTVKISRHAIRIRLSTPSHPSRPLRQENSHAHI